MLKSYTFLSMDLFLPFIDETEKMCKQRGREFVCSAWLPRTQEQVEPLRQYSKEFIV